MKGQCVESRRAGFDCWNTTLVRQQLFKLPPFFFNCVDWQEVAKMADKAAATTLDKGADAYLFASNLAPCAEPLNSKAPCSYVPAKLRRMQSSCSSEMTPGECTLLQERGRRVVSEVSQV